MNNYVPDMLDQHRRHDRRPVDVDYLQCQFCGEEYDVEDEKTCDGCGKAGCRKCIVKCSNPDCPDNNTTCSDCCGKDLECKECHKAEEQA